ncbi:MAG: transcriptional regulator [Candidatus Bathyarchaeia archaeon]|jgi:predicted DNA-binding transcriptional regulator
MNKDRAIGTALLVGSVVGIIVYAWLVYAFPVMVLQVTAFVAVAGVLIILAWIGWTMATTPPPVPLESEPALTQTDTVAGSERKGQ